MRVQSLSRASKQLGNVALVTQLAVIIMRAAGGKTALKERRKEKGEEQEEKKEEKKYISQLPINRPMAALLVDGLPKKE